MIYKRCKCGRALIKGLNDKEKIYPAVLINEKKNISICLKCYNKERKSRWVNIIYILQKKTQKKLMHY